MISTIEFYRIESKFLVNYFFNKIIKTKNGQVVTTAPGNLRVADYLIKKFDDQTVLSMFRFFFQVSGNSSKLCKLTWHLVVICLLVGAKIRIQPSKDPVCYLRTYENNKLVAPKKKTEYFNLYTFKYVKVINVNYVLQ